jgi:hypothetical protein
MRSTHLSAMILLKREVGGSVAAGGGDGFVMLVGGPTSPSTTGVELDGGGFLLPGNANRFIVVVASCRSRSRCYRRRCRHLPYI